MRPRAASRNVMVTCPTARAVAPREGCVRTRAPEIAPGTSYANADAAHTARAVAPREGFVRTRATEIAPGTSYANADAAHADSVTVRSVAWASSPSTRRCSAVS